MGPALTVRHYLMCADSRRGILRVVFTILVGLAGSHPKIACTLNRMRRLFAFLFVVTTFCTVACSNLEEMGANEPDEESASFSVTGNTATMRGIINSSTPDAVRDLIADHPTVTKIVLTDVPGSADDDANLEAARLVRKARLATHANSDSVLASGGVDFFLAGATRTFDSGAKFGVHSWEGDEQEGAALPKDSPEHKMYLDYYSEMGVDLNFYWFTLKAAPAAGIHWMTTSELVQYKFAT